MESDGNSTSGSVLINETSKFDKIQLPNLIDGVVVNVFDSSAVDRGFESRSGQTKDYKIGICFFSAKHAALRRKCGATRLLADCCFSILALYKSNSACWSRTKRTWSSSSHWKLACSRHDIAEQLLTQFPNKIFVLLNVFPVVARRNISAFSVSLQISY